MKTGLIMEGGAMRGMFTCGVTDVWMENGITFDGAIGVSAGACFGCNVKSNQIGRAIRYNKKYCKDKRYAGLGSLLKTGNVFGAEFCYQTLPFELDLWDHEAFQKNPMDFFVTCTDVETGEAVYYRCDTGLGEDIQWMRASASMPLVSRIVRLRGKKLLDGGIADSIPIRYFQSIGYNRNVIIETQPREYRKEKNKFLLLAKVQLRKYPKMIEAMSNRHIRYNETKRYIREQEREGKVFVVRPPEPLHISAIPKSPEELERVYQIGRKAGMESLESVKEFLNIQ